MGHRRSHQVRMGHQVRVFGFTQERIKEWAVVKRKQTHTFHRQNVAPFKRWAQPQVRGWSWKVRVPLGDTRFRDRLWAISEGQRPQNTTWLVFTGWEFWAYQWEDYSNYFWAGAEISRIGPLATFGILWWASKLSWRLWVCHLAYADIL